jgi:hypothetical protein
MVVAIAQHAPNSSQSTQMTEFKPISLTLRFPGNYTERASVLCHALVRQGHAPGKRSLFRIKRWQKA